MVCVLLLAPSSSNFPFNFLYVLLFLTNPLLILEFPAMAKRTLDLLGHISPAHHLDLNALLRYCSSNVPAFPSFPSNFLVSQVLLLSMLSLTPNFIALILFLFVDFVFSFPISGD